MHVSRFTHYVRNTFRINATSWQLTVPASGQQWDSLPHYLIRCCFLCQIKFPTVEIIIGQDYLNTISGLMTLCSLLRNVWKMA